MKRYLVLGLLASAVGCQCRDGAEQSTAQNEPRPKIHDAAPVSRQPIPNGDAALRPGRRATATRASVDCDALLTVADIQQVCGPGVRSLKSTASEQPGRNCNRAGGSYNARLLFMLAIGTGDVGHQAAKPRVFRHTVGAERWETVVVRKQPFQLELRASHHEGTVSPCDSAKLLALTERVLGRLP